MTGGSNTRRKPAGVRGHADVFLHGEAKISHLRSKWIYVGGEKKNGIVSDWLLSFFE